TSPIRRYPDLQIHRIIKENLKGGISEKRISHYNSILSGVSDIASKTERRADEAERETEKLKKVEYMEEHIGEVFEGVISGITGYGIYVELPNTIEGMVHVNALDDDFYYYDEEKYEMIGKDTGRKYKLGEKVLIQVVGCDKITRTIDFIMAEPVEEE
ncbi:MAG: S1 RNA-binding domain-containing protein, partial [Lachnospiraceae bacterium]|nr:S1 RNA-binding domain-containing protein [Lachnospiraceae bacterium]